VTRRPLAAPAGDPRSLRVGEMRIAKAPGRLVIHGLGSCVAVFVYDPQRQVGGLAHILLPTAPEKDGQPPGRYVPTAVAAVIDEVIRRGARRSALLAKVAGGSKMFSLETDGGQPGVGDRNIEAALRSLETARIEVVATDVGGECGRTVEADLADGALLIRTVRGQPRKI
jgi:chemotaxis protein CheD